MFTTTRMLDSDLPFASRNHRLDIADAIGPTGSIASHHSRDVVGNKISAEIHFLQRSHQLPHVGVAVVDEGLDEMRNWSC